MPRESGAHLIHVLQHDPNDVTSATERHVPGSPFRIVVGGRYELADPSLVHAVGEGLVRGQVRTRCAASASLMFLCFERDLNVAVVVCACRSDSARSSSSTR